MEMVDPLDYGRYAEDTLSHFLERFVDQRVVLLVTDSFETARQLAPRTASLDVVCPRSVFEQGKVENARHTDLPPDSSPLPFDSACFDAIVVPEVRLLGDAVPQRLAELVSLLDKDGVMVVGTEDFGSLERPGGEGTASRDDSGYRQLYRIIAEHLPLVRVVGQSPFLGASFHDLAEAENITEVDFDGSLLEERSESPFRVLLVCARENLAMEPFTVIQAHSDNFRAGDHTLGRRLTGGGDEDDELQHATEIRRLESLLRERGERIRELEGEVASRSALARDLMQRIDGERPDGEGMDARRSDAYEGQRQAEAEERRLRSELDAATSRALEAEAARVDAVLRLDEVSGRLALMEATPENAIEELEKERAALLGTVRGMRSAVFELEESRDAAEARLVLAIHDLDDARGRARLLERRLEETREQFELELARASRSSLAGEREPWDEKVVALAGERDGLQARCLDAERSVSELLERNDALQRSADTLKDQIDVLQTSVGGLTASESVLRSRLSELESSQSRDRRQEDVDKEKDTRIGVLEDELGERDRKIEQTESLLARTQSELERLREQLDQDMTAAVFRAEAAESRAIVLREALEEARASLFRLADSLVDTGEQAGSVDGSSLDVGDLDQGTSGSES
jgi:hypothetical protein